MVKRIIGHIGKGQRPACVGRYPFRLTDQSRWRPAFIRSLDHPCMQQHTTRKHQGSDHSGSRDQRVASTARVGGGPLRRRGRSPVLDLVPSPRASISRGSMQVRPCPATNTVMSHIKHGSKKKISACLVLYGKI
jgi:hypothetical protein